MEDDIKIRQRLNTLGEQRRSLDADTAKLRQKRHRLDLNVANLAPKAVAAGIPKTEIAKRAGLSRQQLYAILDED